MSAKVRVEHRIDQFAWKTQLPWVLGPMLMG